MLTLVPTTPSGTDWTAVGIALLFSFLIFRLVGWRKKKSNLPPGPRPWPIVGNIPLLFAKKLPHEVFNDLAKLYGGIVTVKLGAATMIHITDPDIIKECLTASDQLLANRPPLASFKYVGYKDGAVSLTPYGEHWRYARRLLVTEVVSQKRVQQFDSVRADEVAIALHETFEASKRKEIVDLRTTFSKAVMNMFTRISFGRRLYASEGYVQTETTEEISTGQKLRQCIEDMIHIMPEFMFENLIPSLSWMDVVTGTRPKMRKIFKELDILMSDLVDSRSKKMELDRLKANMGESRDFLDSMLSLRDGDAAAASYLKNRNLKALLVDLIGAGSETTICVVEYAIAQLMANPEMMAKAQAELDFVVGKDRCIVTSDVDNLPYMHAVVKETLRLHTGPALLPRCNLVDFKIAGYDIPANSFISLGMYAAHRDGKYWDEPLQFKPDRFLHANLEFTGKEYFYIPFGAGRRMCPLRIHREGVLLYSLWSRQEDVPWLHYGCTIAPFYGGQIHTEFRLVSAQRIVSQGDGLEREGGFGHIQTSTPRGRSHSSIGCPFVQLRFGIDSYFESLDLE